MTAPARGGIWRLDEADATPIPALVARVIDASGVPADQQWWFAWSETELMLPRRLQDPGELDGHWDVVHVFTPSWELRRIRRGPSHLRLLLTEREPPPHAWGPWQMVGGPYITASSWRILWGGRLRLPEGDRRGLVAFPRQLDYGLAREDEAYDSAVVADVLQYYDHLACLQTVRYVRLRHVATGSLDVTPVPELAELERVMP